jgi:hypothetical protein
MQYCQVSQRGIPRASRQHVVIVDPLAALRQRDPIPSSARTDVDHGVWYRHPRRQPIQESNAEAAIPHQPGTQPSAFRYSSNVSRTRPAITAGSSSIANVTVRSNPCEPVMRTRNPPLNGSAAIHCFVRTVGVPATRDDGRLDALAASAGNALDVEYRERHTEYCSEQRRWEYSGRQRRRPEARRSVSKRAAFGLLKCESSPIVTPLLSA